MRLCGHGATPGNCDRCHEYAIQAGINAEATAGENRAAVLAFLARPEVREAMIDQVVEMRDLPLTRVRDVVDYQIAALRALAEQV